MAPGIEIGGRGRRGSKAPASQSLLTHPFPPYIFIIYIQAPGWRGGTGRKENALSRVGTTQAPYPLRTFRRELKPGKDLPAGRVLDDPGPPRLLLSFQ